MKKITIENQEVVNHLEALGYEAAARKELLSHMAQAGVLPGDPAFQAYHKEYEASLRGSTSSPWPRRASGSPGGWTTPPGS